MRQRRPPSAFIILFEIFYVLAARPKFETGLKTDFVFPCSCFCTRPCSVLVDVFLFVLVHALFLLFLFMLFLSFIFLLLLLFLFLFCSVLVLVLVLEFVLVIVLFLFLLLYILVMSICYYDCFGQLHACRRMDDSICFEKNQMFHLNFTLCCKYC